MSTPEQPQYPAAPPPDPFAGQFVHESVAVPDPAGPPSPDYPARLEIAYPAELNRWLPLVKWLLVIPHIVVLAFLFLGAFFAVIIAWFAILFTGRYPRGLFDYVVGVARWALRVSAYATLLLTDRYPPFRLG